ncbi:MAG TPA: Maf family protein [Acidimicrobiales bacterium]|nr:Maf family protein [Acidimicrobiales bacterium]
MPARTLVLASGSPARLKLLRDSGFDPVVRVSGVDEDGIDPADTPGSVARLAAAKAEAVARPGGNALVVGCDSMLEFDGRPHGKPISIGEARTWLAAMRGRSGVLYTGHSVIDEATGARAHAVVGTTVLFGDTTDAELDAYLSGPDVLEVAGAFTLDGRSAPFVDGIVGDPGNVIGLSLPALRSLLGELGVSITDLWRDCGR